MVPAADLGVVQIYDDHIKIVCRWLLAVHTMYPQKHKLYPHPRSSNLVMASMLTMRGIKADETELIISQVHSIPYSAQTDKFMHM